MERIQQITQLFVFGFDGTEPDAHILRMIRNFGIGGVILFSRNIRDPLQTARLIHSLQDASAIPLLVGIDQEGGRVSRLPSPFTSFPGNHALGLSGSRKLSYAFGRATAEELSSVGINLNFAPVLDVNTRPENPVIGTRAFGGDASLVADLGCSVIRGLQDHGVIACGKHFPGHGDTSLDSHLDLPSVHHNEERIRSLEMLPFQRALLSGMETVMTAHVLYPALDTVLPATLSRRIIQNILREELRFNGVVFTDDLEMKAVEDRWGMERSSVLAINAGVDALIICHDPEKQEKGLHAVMDAVEKGEIPVERIEAAAARILDLKRRWLKTAFYPDLHKIETQVGSREHRELALTIAGYGG
ncbi:MAG: beta-N-acetylhexosaminidase [bacterium]